MTDDTHKVELTRVFEAPRDIVFRAFTEPALMRRWLLRGTCVDAEVDARVGGRYRLTGEMPYGTAVAFGEFVELDPPSRLVFTFSWEQIPIGETLVTVELEARAGETVMRFLHERFPDGQTASVHEAVWPKDFDLLQALLAELGEDLPQP